MDTQPTTMLDPSWTTENAYSHASAILARLRRHDELVAKRRKLRTPDGRLLAAVAMPLSALRLLEKEC